MVKLILAYDGAAYNGWQIQANGVGIQAVVQRAVRKMTQEKNVVIGASRTDAGVHAFGQVAHFQTMRTIPVHGWLRGLNSILPPSIRVREVHRARATFHARRGARWKHYRYLIGVGPSASPFWVGRAWHLFAPLNVRAMRKAATALIGRHNFRAFAAANDGNRSKVRTVYRLDVRCSEEGVVINIVGNGFLKQMVRNIVGTLVEVGEGKRRPEEFRAIVAKRDRRLAGRCAPPGGLYLVRVGYTKGL